MIQEQGKDAPVAAWIYTQNDVIDLDDNFEPVYLPLDMISEVLEEVEDQCYIHDKIGECIDDMIHLIKNKK